MTCTKCGVEERANFSSWGKRCLAAQAKARRMRRDATVPATGDATDATAVVAPLSQDESPEPPDVASAGRPDYAYAAYDVVAPDEPLAVLSESDDVPCDRCRDEYEGLQIMVEKLEAAHRLDVQVFEEQIAGLKILNAGLNATIATLTDRIATLEFEAGEGRRSRTSGKASPKAYVTSCAGPGRCQKYGCPHENAVLA